MADGINISNCATISFSSSGDKHLSAFVLIFNKKLLISSGYGLTEFYSHACTKPPDVSSHFTSDRANINRQTKNNEQTIKYGLKIKRENSFHKWLDTR
ncbi:hypothetical protein, partial [Parafilimonas sp.]|uniref:hypothetical protein n=1 Tax=Parafilimonas sp. TaxID=1969739 RepID=UPI0039E46978